MNEFPYIWLIAAGVGMATEITARLARFWIYARPIYPIANVLVMFGLVMGALATRVPGWGLVAVSLAALAIGYGYEMANFRLLRWWHFPQDRFLVFRGEQGCAWSVACLWAAVPGLVHLVATMTLYT